MENRIRTYVEELFESAPHTKKVYELKEELLANLIEKYNDLVQKGCADEQAYSIVIEGIGDVDELIYSMTAGNPLDWKTMQHERKKTAAVVSISVGLYILSVLQLIAFGIALPIRGGEIGVVLMFVIAAAATCLLIYHFMSRPVYKKADETMIEDFKEWKATNNRDKKLLNSISSTLWSIIVAVYLITSFLYGIWAYSWLIFIVGVALNAIIKLIFDLKNSGDNNV